MSLRGKVHNAANDLKFHRYDFNSVIPRQSSEDGGHDEPHMSSDHASKDPISEILNENIVRLLDETQHSFSVLKTYIRIREEIIFKRSCQFFSPSLFLKNVFFLN